jgi:hypothetical protein
MQKSSFYNAALATKVPHRLESLVLQLFGNK